MQEKQPADKAQALAERLARLDTDMRPFAEAFLAMREALDGTVNGHWDDGCPECTAGRVALAGADRLLEGDGR